MSSDRLHESRRRPAGRSDGWRWDGGRSQRLENLWLIPDRRLIFHASHHKPACKRSPCLLQLQLLAPCYSHLIGSFGGFAKSLDYIIREEGDYSDSELTEALELILLVRK